MQLSILLLLLSFTIYISAVEVTTCTKTCKDMPIGYKITDCTDCTGYFICHHDAIQHYCPSGTKFVEDKQGCVVGKCPPCDCDCDLNDTTSTTTDSTIPTVTIPTIPTVPTKTTTTSPEPDCQFVPNGTLFPHNEHCRYFWQCVNLEAILRFCEFGLWYDPTRYLCDYPPYVYCPANID